jgi:hypothetical protein
VFPVATARWFESGGRTTGKVAAVMTITPVSIDVVNGSASIGMVPGGYQMI